MYVLFSPIGMSDPTEGNYDGPFLHILRHYKPYKAYLYMTKEVCEYDRKDNRYEFMAGKLMSQLNFECEIVKRKFQDIDNPQEFEIFYEPFEKIINNLRKENPEAQIIVNVSSGTPQMKNAANMLCAVSKFPIIPVQVKSPQNESNKNRELKDNYNIEKEWNNLKDNHTDPMPENRLKEVSVKNIRAMILRENIISHIKAYDYEAALRAAEEISYYVDDKAIILIRAGSMRISLSLKKAEKEANSAGYDLHPIKDIRVKEIFEYLQYLYIKNIKKEMADFIRGISPLVSDLFEMYLTEKCKVNIYQYCTGNDMKILRKEKMKPEMQNSYDDYFNKNNKNGEGFRNGFLCAANMLPMIIFQKVEPHHIEVAKNLRSIEEKTRNIVAHEIVEVNDQWLKNKSGFSSSEIYELLKEMFEITFESHIKGDIWNTYDNLNEEIISKLSLA